MGISLLPDSTSVLIMRDDYKVLACSRKDDPEEFGMPGGKVDVLNNLVVRDGAVKFSKDRSLSAAASRELYEKTNVDIFHEFLQFFHTGICKGSTNYMNHTFLINNSFREHSAAEIRPCQVEGEGRVAWIPPLLLLHGPFAGYNRIILEKVGYIINNYIPGNMMHPPYIEQTTINDMNLTMGLPGKTGLLEQIEVCPG